MNSLCSYCSTPIDGGESVCATCRKAIEELAPTTATSGSMKDHEEDKPLSDVVPADAHTIILCRYESQVEANLARQALQNAGIPAFLSGEEALAMDWRMTIAFGAIKLHVVDHDEAKAREVLEKETKVEVPKPLGEDLAETDREATARRAYQGAVIGVVFCPLQFYVTILLVHVWTSSERLNEKGYRTAVLATLINIVAMTVMALLFRSMIVR